MFYSKQTNGFYDTAIHGDNIPKDAVEISSEEHMALLEGQSKGLLISTDEKGYPILIDPPAPSLEQLASQVRSERDSKLLATEWLVKRHSEQLQIDKTTLSEEQYQELLIYRQALRDVPEQTGFPESVEWPVAPDFV